MGSKEKKADTEGLVAPAKALEEMIAGDVLGLDDLAKYPVIQEASPRHQAILCAYACGYGTSFIGKMVGMKQPNVTAVLNKYDPDRMFKIGPDAKKAFITRIIESRMMEAITSITPEKLEASTAKECAGIMKDCATVAANMNQSKHAAVRPGMVASLMEAAERERIEKLPSAEVIDED